MICYAPNVTGPSTPRTTSYFTTSVKPKIPPGKPILDNVTHLIVVNRSKIYTPCDPVTVKVGQLVEIQVSFCVVPVSKGKYVRLNKLRAICILSTQVQEVGHVLSKHLHI